MRMIKKYNATDINNLYERLSKSESKLLKEKFAENFCDVNSVNYKEYVKAPGYILWSCMPGGAKLLTIDDIVENPPFKGDVYVFWDYFNIDNEMFKLGRNFVYKIPFQKFLKNFLHFPQDTYVFDNELRQVIVLSHEHFHSEDQYLSLYKK